MKLQIGPVVFGSGPGEDTQLRRRHGQGSSAAQSEIGAHDQPARQGMVGLVEGAQASNPEDGALLQVNLQIAADAGELVLNGNAGIGEHFGGADARPLQQMGRTDSTSAQHDFGPCMRLMALTTSAEVNPGDPLAVEHQRFCHGASHDCEIGTLADGFEKSPRRRPAQAALLVHMKIANAFIAAGIEIRDRRDAHLSSSPRHRIQDVPTQPWRLYAPLPAGAMLFGTAQEMIFDLAKHGQHAGPAPSRQTHAPPAFIIHSVSAHGDHGVDR